MPESDRASRTPTSIVCVYNDPDVLEGCLARSIREGLPSAPQTEFIAVDNRGNPFPGAGAALNHGARLARNDVVVFVHQDVVLHSLVALEEAAAVLMAEPDIGIAGAVGIDARHRILGRIRDRVVPIGEVATEPRDVESLDEVLLLLRRERVWNEPLSEDPLLAWHAYGVEYSARSRRAGLRAVALDIPLTHNSLTTNLEALDLAHGRVGELYPELVPLQTTCGTIWGGDPPGGLGRQLRRMRGARAWWGESLEARALASVAPSSPIVLADIRLSIDEALARGDMGSLRVLDLAPGDSTPTAVDGLSRYGKPLAVATVPPAVAREAMAHRDERELLLITAARSRDLAPLGPLGHLPHVVGHMHEIGVWVLIGVSAPTLEPLWAGTRSRPFAGLIRFPREASTAPDLT
ncbi:glycosyltransferase [Microbacterium sp. PRC9]|uniref:glycosyltransferase n=1 Tax=Microbacterium sp. PRC9 TaxID=2962591 RepID=UPI0028822873|nr:glycosyltransferase [Microbacterium sp. PRC9]MDT0144603.1 glycosyltransferase [Microbacterium sp. PRC9]